VGQLGPAAARGTEEAQARRRAVQSGENILVASGTGTREKKRRGGIKAGEKAAGGFSIWSKAVSSLSFVWPSSRCQHCKC
jgi:hypothetical protein